LMLNRLFIAFLVIYNIVFRMSECKDNSFFAEKDRMLEK